MPVRRTIKGNNVTRTTPRRGATKNPRAVSAHQALVARLRRAATLRAKRAERTRGHELRRHESNPIIAPREDRYWEMKATFNPGAVYADHRVHLLYRAIGGDDVSVLGYASSPDGVTITDRSDLPAFVPDKHKREEPEKPVDLSRIQYLSGGGWNGGSEDPRLTVIGDRVYLIYTAFDGWGSVRIALSSIGLGDFLDHRWSWKQPALISPPGEIHKNWVLFPEKIHGKFALLHSISPVIEIAYFDNMEALDEGKRHVESHYNRISGTGKWDNWVRGAGPPPIKTKLGWLLLYHAMDARDPNRYKIGAMILDPDDPTKILYRSHAPILEPDAHYENNGFKSGVVYACGAVVKDGELYVYYGGSDSVTCVAMAKLDTFLEEIKRSGTPRLESTRSGRRALS